MSYVNGTTHYNLPQTVGTDKRDWADTNQAFADVDAALYGAVDDVAQAQTKIDALTGRMNTAEENIADNTADIAGLDTRLTTAEGAITSQASQITDARQDLEDMICAYNEATATSTHAYEIGDYFIYNDVLYKATQAIAIGDTIVPDTNCETTNVSTELLSSTAEVIYEFVGDGATTYATVIDAIATKLNIDTSRTHRYIIEFSETAQNKYGEISALGVSTNGYFFGCSIFVSFGELYDTWNITRGENGTPNFTRIAINLTDPSNPAFIKTSYANTVVPARQTVRLIVEPR